MPGVAQRVGRGIALLFHDRGTRRGWVVSSTPRPHFTPSKDPVPIVQEAVWTPGPVWTGGKSLPHRDSNPDRRARSQSLYRLSYPAYILIYMRLLVQIVNNNFAEPSSSIRLGEIIACPSDYLASSPAGQSVRLCFVEFRTFTVRSCRSRSVNFLCTQVEDTTEHS